VLGCIEHITAGFSGVICGTDLLDGYASEPKTQIGLAATAINIAQRLGGPIAPTAMA
jgi:hypothetical protein